MHDIHDVAFFVTPGFLKPALKVFGHTGAAETSMNAKKTHIKFDVLLVNTFVLSEEQAACTDTITGSDRTRNGSTERRWVFLPCQNKEQ